MFTSLRYSDIFTGCPSELDFPVRLRASVSTTLPPSPLLISLTFYNCTLLLDLFAPVLTPASSKFHSTKCDRALSYFGPSVWNSLPLHVRKATTIDNFAEIKVSYDENPEPLSVFCFKPGVGQNVALYDSPAAKNSAFPIHLTLFLSLSGMPPHSPLPSQN